MRRSPQLAAAAPTPTAGPRLPRPYPSQSLMSIADGEEWRPITSCTIAPEISAEVGLHYQRAQYIERQDPHLARSVDAPQHTHAVIDG